MIKRKYLNTSKYIFGSLVKIRHNFYLNFLINVISLFFKLCKFDLFDESLLIEFFFSFSVEILGIYDEFGILVILKVQKKFSEILIIKK